MPKFNYMARDNAGASAEGVVVARSEIDARQILRSEGKFVIRIGEAADDEQGAAVVVRTGSRRVKPDDVIFFCSQLAGMIDTGVPIAEALEATIDGSPQGAFRRTVEDIIARVQEGSEFSVALKAHPKVFPPLLIHMVRASEATGALGPMLKRVTHYLITQRDLKKKIKGALTYPCCMLVFAVGSTIFLLTYVLPQFTQIYAGKAAVLPLPTLVLMTASDWATSNLLMLSGGTLAAVAGLYFYFRSEGGQRTADWLRLNMPVFSKMFQQAYLARALRTLGTMIVSGVSVLEAVLITRDVVGNRLFGQIFEEAHAKLQRGEQLAQALNGAPYIPRPVWQMLHAGERTGQLGESMGKVADIAESDLETTIKTMTQFIEPAMIVIMGSIIGGVATAMLLPIFQISKVMAQ
mgnify:CR=1 FL=1